MLSDKAINIASDSKAAIMRARDIVEHEKEKAKLKAKASDERCVGCMEVAASSQLWRTYECSPPTQPPRRSTSPPRMLGGS